MNLYKKLFFNCLFNLSLFTFLIIGIQNSNQKSKIDFLLNKSVELPTSFIVGVSFISGSLLGSLIPVNKLLKK